MSFKLFFKYNLLLQLLLSSSLSFGNGPAIYIKSSSGSDNCIENLIINAPIKGEVKCKKMMMGRS